MSRPSLVKTCCCSWSLASLPIFSQKCINLHSISTVSGKMMWVNFFVLLLLNPEVTVTNPLITRRGRNNHNVRTRPSILRNSLTSAAAGNVRPSSLNVASTSSAGASSSTAVLTPLTVIRPLPVLSVADLYAAEMLPPSPSLLLPQGPQAVPIDADSDSDVDTLPPPYDDFWEPANPPVVAAPMIVGPVIEEEPFLTSMQHVSLPDPVANGYMKVKGVADEFMCPFCRDVALAPRMSSCGHIFCASCIEDFVNTTRDVEAGSNPRCPLCSAPLGPIVFLPRVLNNIWNLLPRTCVFAGCNVIVSNQEYERHFLDCQRRCRPCSVCNIMFNSPHEFRQHVCFNRIMDRKKKLLANICRLYHHYNTVL